MNVNILGVCFGFDFVRNSEVDEEMEKLENV